MPILRRRDSRRSRKMQTLRFRLKSRSNIEQTTKGLNQRRFSFDTKQRMRGPNNYTTHNYYHPHFFTDNYFLKSDLKHSYD